MLNRHRRASSRNHRAMPLVRVVARPTHVEAAAIRRALPGAAPTRSSFQKMPHPPATARPIPGAVSTRPTAATARGRPTSAAWPVAATRW